MERISGARFPGSGKCGEGQYAAWRPDRAGMDDFKAARREYQRENVLQVDFVKQFMPCRGQGMNGYKWGVVIKIKSSNLIPEDPVCAALRVTPGVCSSGLI